MLEKRLVLFGSELYWLACRTKSEGNVTMEKKSLNCLLILMVYMNSTIINVLT